MTDETVGFEKKKKKKKKFNRIGGFENEET